MKSPLAQSPTTATAGTAGTAMDAATLCEAFQRTTAMFPTEVALATADGSTSITWSGYAQRVERIAAGLAWAGVGRGDTVAMMLTNRPEAMLVDTAALHLGATPFSIYNSSAPEQIVYLLTNAAPRVVVTEAQFLDKLLDAREQLTAIEHVVVVDAGVEARAGGLDGSTITLADLERRSPVGFDFAATWRQVDPADVATLIYTSGTTGPPKGVQLTHDNIVWKWRSWNEMIGFEGGGRHVSYLPMAHIGDRTMAHYLHLLVGGSLTCVDNYNAIVGLLPVIRPTVFTGMPRLWEKLKTGMERSFAADPDPARRRAVQQAIDVGVRRVRAEQLGQPAPAELAGEHDAALSTVLATVRAGMGMDRVELMISGGAPIAAEVLQFFSALGLPICEGWGLSEAGASVTVNPRDGIRIGTVGLPTPGVELRQLDDGEILIRGPLVMKGYRNDPVQTAEAIDDDGWLHSGDIGRIDDEGYLTIIDRKKNLIITSSGKNMSPNLIESHVRNACPLVGQILVVGDGRQFVTALLQLDHDALAVFAREHDLTTTAPDDLVTDPAVLAAVQRGIDAANVRLSRAEQIKKFVVVPGQWVPDSEEMTPTAKLRRRVVITKYEGLIQSMYGG